MFFQRSEIAGRKPRDLFALYQRRAVGRLDVTQHAWCMANGRNNLAGGRHGLDQLDRMRVFGQVPQRAMAARIKHRVKAARQYL